MMTWDTPTSFKQLLQQRFERGDYIKAHFNEAFPLRLRLKKPTINELKLEFTASKEWAERWGRESVPLEYKTVRTAWWAQDLPVAVIFPTLRDLAAYAQRTYMLNAYRQALYCANANAQLRRLLPFLTTHPQYLLKMKNSAQDFPRMLAVCRYILEHPQHEIYLRALDLPQIDSKFVEQHATAIGRLLDILLPPERIDDHFSAGRNFAARYGFKSEPDKVTFRLLDDSLPQNLHFNTLGNVTLDVDVFAAQQIAGDFVIICENKKSYLALPPLPRTLAIFGKGFGFSHWHDFVPLQGKRIIYWGDLDSAGFAILHQLRCELSPTPVQSMLMDVPTLRACLYWAGPDPLCSNKRLPHLTDSEQEAYQAVVTGAFGQKKRRLEQERIPERLVRRALQQALHLEPA